MSRLAFLRVQPGSWPAHAYGVLLVLAAGLLRWGMAPYVPAGEIPFITFFPAILAATFIGGIAVGCTALVLGLLVAWWAFVPPAYSFELQTSSHGLSLFLYIAAGVLIMLAAEHYRRLVARLYEEEHHRSMLVAELNHRIKNKISTVYAIVARELKHDSEAWRRVQGRLQALTATDDFIARSETGEVSILQLITRELAPYSPARTSIRADDIRLSEKPATLLSLVLHELATNAAKYGALSAAEGTVSVICARSGDRVHIEWLESGGPPVTAPASQGFGSSLIARAMDPYDGHTEMQFDPNGLRCVISFAGTAAADSAAAERPPISAGEENALSRPAPKLARRAALT